MDNTETATGLLSEIRDLLRIIAEPQIAERDRKLRDRLREIANTDKRQAACAVMDGTKPQKEVATAAKMDAAGVSRLTKALREADLLTGNPNPELSIHIPANFFA